MMISKKQILMFPFAWILLSALFLVIPVEKNEITLDDGSKKEIVVMHKYFPFSNSECSFQEYVYYLCQHLMFVALFFVMAKKIESNGVLFIYFFISLADTLDFMLTYNSRWGSFGGIPISFNTVQAVLITCLMVTIKDD